MKDAGAHGADRSPDYQTTLKRLSSTEAALAAQIQSAEPAKAAAATTPPADPLDALNAPAPIDPAVLAQIRATGVVVADQNQEGHGVAAQTTAPGGAAIRI